MLGQMVKRFQWRRFGSVGTYENPELPTLHGPQNGLLQVQ